MLFSLCSAALRWMLELAVLRVRSNQVKDLEIVVLRHELAILRRRSRRPALTWTDRLCLAAASRLLPGTMARVHRYAGDAPALASTPGGETLDVPASSWPSADSA